MEASGIVMEPGTTYPETCSQCGGSDLRRETVRSAFWHDERLVVVENIPALVCGSCGERYYDDPTIARIDILRGEGFPPDKARGELRVPVFALREPVKR